MNIKRTTPLLVVLLFVAGYMTMAYLTLGEEPRRVPVLVGYVTLLLVALELIRGGMPGRDTGAVPETTESEEKPVRLLREFTAVLYVAGLVTMIYLVGYFIAIPLYLFASLFWLGRQTIRLSLLVTIIASTAIYLVFELMLEYRLYQGLLLS